MNPSHEELEELAEHARQIHAALARTRSELEVATAAEQALLSKLRALGASPIEEDDAKTTVSDPETLGLWGDRRGREAHPSALKAAALGAGLVLGIAVVVLLAINVVVSRRPEVSTTNAPPPIAVATARDDSRAIPPPPPPAEAEPPAPPPAPSVAAPQIASAVVPKSEGAPASNSAPSATGFLTVTCTPKCDAISDNNVPLVPSNVVNMPIAAGVHKLALSAPNGVKKTLIINIAPGQSQSVRVPMDAGAHDYGF